MAEMSGYSAKARSSCASRSSIIVMRMICESPSGSDALGVSAPESAQAHRADALALIAEHADDARMAAIHQIAGRFAARFLVVDRDRRVLRRLDRAVEQGDRDAAVVQDVEVLEVARLGREDEQHAVGREVRCVLDEASLLDDGVVGLEDDERVVVLLHDPIDPGDHRGHEEHVHLRDDERDELGMLGPEVPRAVVRDVAHRLRGVADAGLGLRADVRMIRQGA